MRAYLHAIVMGWRQLLGNCPRCGAQMMEYRWKLRYCPHGCE
jgi:hypothetical protein